jgi:putative glycosyltransferase (TIGR04372 family)
MRKSACYNWPVNNQVHSSSMRSSTAARLFDSTLSVDSYIYRKLIGTRRRLKPAIGVMSQWVDNTFAEDRVGSRLIKIAYRGGRAKRRGPVSRGERWVLRWGLILAAVLHLGASKRGSAVKCARIMKILFRPEIQSRRGLLARIYFQILLLSAAYERLVHEMPEQGECENYLINFAVGTGHLYMLKQPTAQYFLTRAVALAHDQSYEARRRLGCSYLLAHDEHAAAREFQRSVELYPASVMPHHSYAARNEVGSYLPKTWELIDAGRLLIYDNLVRLGEQFYWLGQGDESMRAYQRALRYQTKISRSASLPAELLNKVKRQCRSFNPNKPIRLLGSEWAALIGHMGCVDWHMRMVRLEMLPQANYLLLAPPGKIANTAMLDCLESLCCVIRDPALVDELFPYQRFFGDQFIAFPSDDGELAEPWPHAAARAQRLWTEKKLPPQLSISDEDREFGKAALKRLGLPSDAWYVSLHVREGGFHGDGSGTMIAHRIAAIDDYFSGIREIVDRGGWVIRLGDKSMKPLPRMPRVVDYVHTTEKSPKMDVFLMATSRFVIGTTSGPATATLAFGTPMLLVNCIAAEPHFWTQETDFMVKSIFDRRRGRYLTLGEICQEPFRSLLVSATMLSQRGYQVIDNTADEIRDAVAYKLDCMDGRVQRLDEQDPLTKQYRAALAHDPINFGAALPAKPFLEAHPELLMR